METRRYFSQRNNKTNEKVSLVTLKKVFTSVFDDFESRGYFTEWFGDFRHLSGMSGKAGENLSGYVLRKLRKEKLWPIEMRCHIYSEEDLFDMIEFLFDHISEPLGPADPHEIFSPLRFDELSGQKEFVIEMNQFLNDYEGGYELSNKGEILSLMEPEFRPLLDAVVPTDDPENIEAKVKTAVDKYRKYGSTLNERIEAVRILADCLEYLRPKIKAVLAHKDEADLFNIANNFGIRHHNENQQTNYDKNIFLAWMFYFYLATIHACLRLINKTVL